MASQNTRYLVEQQGGPLIVKKGERPIITEPPEVIIRLKAIAVNPADCKMIYEGHRVSSWPLVPGLDGAGVVEAIGNNVKDIKIGDEVLAMFAAGDRGGSYQTLAVVRENMVAKKPPMWTFEEAASLAVSYFTGVAALGIGLKISLPFIKEGPTASFRPSSVLILGGSSALGAATTQLLRLAIPECMILVTSSPKHHAHITHTLGADKAFDRTSATLIEDIILATPEKRGVDAIIDTVGAGATDRNVFDAFDSKGPRRYAQVWTGDDEIQVPAGVDSVLFRSRDLSQLQGGENVMLGLQNLLEAGKYRPPLPIRKIASLREGLEVMREGVSGEKLVVAL